MRHQGLKQHLHGLLQLMMAVARFSITLWNNTMMQMRVSQKLPQDFLQHHMFKMDAQRIRVTNSESELEIQLDLVHIPLNFRWIQI